jgi:hypothetical protein
MLSKPHLLVNNNNNNEITKIKSIIFKLNKINLKKNYKNRLFLYLFALFIIL